MIPTTYMWNEIQIAFVRWNKRIYFRRVTMEIWFQQQWGDMEVDLVKAIVSEYDFNNSEVIWNTENISENLGIQFQQQWGDIMKYTNNNVAWCCDRQNAIKMAVQVSGIGESQTDYQHLSKSGTEQG